MGPACRWSVPQWSWAPFHHVSALSPRLGFEFPITGHPCHVSTAHMPEGFPSGAGVCQHMSFWFPGVPQSPPNTLQILVSPGGPCPALPSSPGGGWSAGTPLAGTLCPGPGMLLAQAEGSKSQGGPGQTLHGAPAPSQQKHPQASTGLCSPRQG